MGGRSQAEVIKTLIGRARVVRVGEQALSLTVPKLADALPIMERAMATGESSEEQGGAELAGEWIELAAAAVAACLGIGEEDAGRLVLASGGQISELATVALELCGLPRAGPESPDGGDDPTSTS